MEVKTGNSKKKTVAVLQLVSTHLILLMVQNTQFYV